MMNYLADRSPAVYTTLLALASVLVGLTGGAQAEFAIPEAQFRDTVKKIAVLPSRIRIETDDNYVMQRTFDALVDEVLDKSGVDYIPVDVFRAVQTDTAEAIGGSYDIYTGELDVEKAKTIEDLTFREFERLHEFDAYLIPAVVRVMARYDGNDAAWDDVERYSTGADRGLFSDPGNLRGALPAASFLAAVIDKTEADTTYYAGRTGIELLLFIEPAKVFSTVGYTLPEPDKRLRNPQFNQEAVSKSLAPLIAVLTAAEVTGDTEAQSGNEPPPDAASADTAPGVSP